MVCEIIHRCVLLNKIYGASIQGMSSERLLPEPVIKRLTDLYLLAGALSDTTDQITSQWLAPLIGSSADSIRKDLTRIKPDGTSTGYDPELLQDLIGEKLGFTKKRRVAVIGLGEQGLQLMAGYSNMDALEVVAGFDSKINRLELIKSKFPLYPTWEIEDVVSQKKVDIAVLSMDAHECQKNGSRLLKGGVKAILNYSPVFLASDKSGPIIKNLHPLSAALEMAARLNEKES